MENKMEQVKLHIGCGNRKLQGFINIDIEKTEATDMTLDVREKLPFLKDSVDFVYSEHFLEHLSRGEAINFLKEIYRVLKPNGVLRISTPDLEALVNGYYKDNWDNLDWIESFGYEWIPTRGMMLNIALRDWGHKYIYDLKDLEFTGKLAGFLFAIPQKFGLSQYVELQNLEYRQNSLIMEFKKESHEDINNIPLVSICIPAYNYNYFEECLISALNP
jgi:predicted SAM-dependent methyltransferase